MSSPNAEKVRRKLTSFENSKDSESEEDNELELTRYNDKDRLEALNVGKSKKRTAMKIQS